MTTKERLEFPQVLDILGGYLISEAGKEALKRLSPLPKEEIEVRYQEISKIIQLLLKGLDVPFDFPPVIKILGKAKIGSTLNPQELLSVARFIGAAEVLSERLLGEEVGSIPDPLPLRSLKKDILTKIDEDGNVRDDASPLLAKVRSEWRIVRRRVLHMMQGLLQEYGQKGLLRDQTVTIRHGRLVLPFLSHVRPRGVVHGVSNTQETIFVEPLETIDLQNKMVRLQEEEKEEVSRILRELRDSLAFHLDLLLAVFDSIGTLELNFAMAKFAADYGCCLPSLAQDGNLRLKGARHPLLVLRKGDEKVVPLDIDLSRETRVFLISGPNAGGKTVALKTVGLAVLMALHGIPVLATKAELPLPSRLFAIGFEDEQDIEKGISSFTALLSDIRRALEETKEGDLVLLDELLASTDPIEGAALAFSILKTLASRGIRVLANTHLTRLKALVEREEGMMNATMEFDPRTRLPTYRLLMGEVGESYALEIARREGLPEQVILQAEAILEGMDEEVKVLSRELRAKENELEVLLKGLREKEEKLERERDKIIKEAKLKASRILRETNLEVEALLKELREASKRERLEKRLKKAKEAREKIKSSLNDLDIFGKPVEKPVLGEKYRVKPFGFIGELMELDEEEASLLVGKRKIKVPRRSLYEVS